MISILKYIILPVWTAWFLSPSLTFRDETYRIAAEAGIPLLQVACREGDSLTVFEVSTVPEICPRADCSTVFQAASLSKPVMAYIIMKMADRGEIDPDTPLICYTQANRFTNRELAGRLTARIVLSQTSGLPNWAASPGSSDWPDAPISFLFRPDSAFSYSGEAFAFLQRALESIKGKGLEEIAREEVFIPLGMHASSYEWLCKYDTLAADGYTREGENRGPGSFPRANAAYTLRTTAGDYMKFLIALNEGTGLSRQSRDAMFFPRVNAVRYPGHPRDCDRHVFWGLGLGIEKHGTLGEVVFHWGDNGRFKSLFLIVPKSRSTPGRILVYFTNSEAGHDIIKPLSFLFLGNEEPLAIHDWVLQQYK